MYTREAHHLGQSSSFRSSLFSVLTSFFSFYFSDCAELWGPSSLFSGFSSSIYKRKEYSTCVFDDSLGLEQVETRESPLTCPKSSTFPPTCAFSCCYIPTTKKRRRDHLLSLTGQPQNTLSLACHHLLSSCNAPAPLSFNSSCRREPGEGNLFFYFFSFRGEVK